MKKSLFAVLVIVLLPFFQGSAIAQIPVILRVSATDQQDSTGCNFVHELCRITYNAILKGGAKLWDSQEKEIRIFPGSLQEIEKSSGTSFPDEDVVFIYEYWSSNGKDLKSNTTGLLFASKDSRGQEVSFGYMDYADLQPFLMGSRIQSNANGNYSATLASYFFSKNYNYNILQFAGKVLDNVTKSKEIKDQFIGNRKFNTSEFSSNEIPQKMVTWLLDTTPSINAEKAKASNDLVKATQDFFKQNEDFFYIFGGDRIVSRLKKKDAWKISRMEVKEIWKKVDGVISFDPVSVQLYVNDSALAEIPYRDMVRFNIQVGLKNWVDYLREKPFQYTILLINNQEIARREAFKYLKALQIYDWNKVTEYVKFY